MVSNYISTISKCLQRLSMYLQVLHLSTVSICVQNPYIYCVSLRQNLHFQYLYLQPPSTIHIHLSLHVNSLHISPFSIYLQPQSIYNTYSYVSTHIQPPHFSIINLPTASIYLQIYSSVSICTYTTSTYLHYQSTYSLYLSTIPINLYLHTNSFHRSPLSICLQRPLSTVSDRSAESIYLELTRLPTSSFYLQYQ
jgi:hypothetical protein